MAALVRGAPAQEHAAPPTALPDDGDAPAAGALPSIDDVSAGDLPWREPYFPFLDDETPVGSVSVGDTSHGYVVNARQLPVGEAWGVLPKQAARDLAWGSDELVGLLERAATVFHARTGSRMWLGNIGRRGGGDIAWSVSHNSGRDADLALSYLDARGAPVDPPDLVALDRSGLSKDGKYRFDAARTWQTIRALVSDPVPVQYLFLSEPLKQKVLNHARIAGEPAALVTRAADVVRQPGGALPHNDHIHLRIYCSARDVEGGCHDTGLVHPWVDLHEEARTRRVRVAAAELADERGDERRRAIERLALLEQRDELPAILRALDDLEPDVREAAAAAVGALGSADVEGAAALGHVAALAHRLDRETDAGVRVALLAAIGELGGPVAGATLARALATLAGTPPSAEPCCDPTAGDDLALEAALTLTPTLPVSVAAPSCLSSLVGCGVTPSPTGPTVAPADRSDGRQAALDRDRVLLAAVDAAGRADRLEPVGTLLALLDDDDVQLRARTAGALSRATNSSFGDAWDDPAQDATLRRQATDRWRSTAKALASRPRDAWLASGFLAAGYRVPSFDKRHLWELARASARGDHLAYNACRSLERITGHHPVGVSWSSPSSCRHWIGWLMGNRQRLELEPVPDATARACP